MTAFVATAAMVVSGCSMLGLSSGAPPDPTITTSAAPLAASGQAGQAVTIPTLATGTPSASAPIPWQSRITSSAAPTTSAGPTLTAPTTTRLSLTFETITSATKPTVVAPTAVGSPPPSCYTDGSCAVIDSASAAGATVTIVNPPGGSGTVAVLTGNGATPTATTVARVTSPTLDCGGSYCLVQGIHDGAYFGNLVVARDGLLRTVPGTASSAGPIRLAGTAAESIVVAGQKFFDYGLALADTPVAWRTWTVSGGSLTATGCGVPRLYSPLPAVTAPLYGSCSGTPQVSGYGAGSAAQMYPLGGFTTSSGNIKCAVLPNETLVCTAEEHSFDVADCANPPAPDGLAPKSGLRVTLGKTGGATYDDCIGYVLLGRAGMTIPYNRVAAGDGFVCSVTTERARCTAPSGHGFTLARAGITTF